MTNPKLIPFDGDRHLTVPALTRIVVRLSAYIKTIEPTDSFKQFQIFEAEAMKKKINHFLERKSRGGVGPCLKDYLVNSINEFNSDIENDYEIQGDDERSISDSELLIENIVDALHANINYLKEEIVSLKEEARKPVISEGMSETGDRSDGM